MSGHINGFKGQFYHPLTRLKNRVGRASVGEDRSIGAPSWIDKMEIDFGNRGDALGNTLENIGVRRTDVRDSLYAVVAGHSWKMKALMKSATNNAKPLPARAASSAEAMRPSHRWK